jgi:hypothetical protein
MNSREYIIPQKIPWSFHRIHLLMNEANIGVGYSWIVQYIYWTSRSIYFVSSCVTFIKTTNSKSKTICNILDSCISHRIPVNIFTASQIAIDHEIMLILWEISFEKYGKWLRLQDFDSSNIQPFHFSFFNCLLFCWRQSFLKPLIQKSGE